MREYLKKAVPRPPESDAAVRSTVSEILAAVRAEGDAAVRRYSEKLDRWSPKTFKLGADEIAESIALLSADDRATIDYCRDQIAAFARHQRESIKEFEVELQDGVRLGQKLIPVSSVGAYVPGGRYPLVASALMSITTAKVAGVGRVIACSPPSPVSAANPRGGVYPATLYAMVAAGVDEVYLRGRSPGAGRHGLRDRQRSPPWTWSIGPGTSTWPRPSGRSSAPSASICSRARRRSLIIADDSADPALVACRPPGPGRARPDLAADPDHDLARRSGWPSSKECERQLPLLGTRRGRRARRGRTTVRSVARVDGPRRRRPLADEYAPEHLEVQTRRRRAGTSDGYATTARSSSARRPPSPTPTRPSARTTSCRRGAPRGTRAGSGWASSSRPLTYQRLSREASARVAPVVARICDIEGMLAHKATADLREGRYGKEPR